MEMYAVERRRWLVDRARLSGRVDVAQVAQELNVARETVRRDLNALEKEGRLRRVHGGAVPVERAVFDGHSLRQAVRDDATGRIADHAVGALAGVELLYLDCGPPSQALAERLRPERPMTVVTNALQVAMILATRIHVDLVLVGGRIRPPNFAAVDHWAVHMLENFVFDLAVMNADAVSLDRGLTCADAAIAAVRARAVVSSRRVMLLAPGATFGADSTYRFAHLRDIQSVVTDRGAGEGLVRRIRAAGVDVAQV